MFTFRVGVEEAERVYSAWMDVGHGPSLCIFSCGRIEESEVTLDSQLSSGSKTAHTLR